VAHGARFDALDGYVSRWQHRARGVGDGSRDRRADDGGAGGCEQAKQKQYPD